MHQILLLGAGRSASTLISYLLSEAKSNNWFVTVADQQLEIAQQKINGHESGRGVSLNVTDETARKKIIAAHDIIISLLPPQLHDLVSADCLQLKKNLATASYVTRFQQEVQREVKNAGILFLCEMGLDPGIDHMSAMEMIHTLKSEGAEILSFKSATGGLVAPESDTNPWHYKVTWNPRNVVLAGQATSQFLMNGKIHYLPYSRLFLETETVKVKSLGNFEAYANRDSLSYIEKYELQNVPTIIRQTLRSKGYCKAWNALVQLGLTDDSFQLHASKDMTYSQLTASFLNAGKKSVEEQLAKFLGEKKNGDVMQKLKWLGLFGNNKINLKNATPAQAIQQLIEQKWKMNSDDKDMIVMRHEFIYKRGKKKFIREAVLVMKGEDQIHTAMSKTVGLPIGVAVKNILNKTIRQKGVCIPVHQNIYQPVLKELMNYGVVFTENEKQISA